MNKIDYRDPNSGFVNMNEGEKVDYIGIPKYSAKDDTSEIISIFSGQAKPIFILWNEKTGYVYYEEGVTDKFPELGRPQPKYIVPIILYNVIKTNKSGVITEYGMPIRPYYIWFGQSTYKSQILEKIKSGIKIDENDYSITCAYSQTQSKMTLTKIENKSGAVWKRDPEMKEIVEEAMPTYWSLLMNNIKISAMNEEQIKTALTSKGNTTMIEQRPGLKPY